jgi:hypothetical protein
MEVLLTSNVRGKLFLGALRDGVTFDEIMAVAKSAKALI